jgi:hypothetical protein
MSLREQIRAVEDGARLREGGPNGYLAVDDIDLLRFHAVGENTQQFVERIEMMPMRVLATQLASNFLGKRNKATVFAYVIARKQVNTTETRGRKNALYLEEK